MTQFGQMCERLGIRIIAANSPQAKGRVERNHGTHQDRLVKKMRLKKIKTHAEANRFLEKEYLPEHNRRFRRSPAPVALYTDWKNVYVSTRQYPSGEGGKAAF